MSSVRRLPAILRVPVRCFSLSAARESKTKTDQQRNFGLVAHIDAGKTTTTECILKRTGAISRRGSVDRGDTVTDFTPQERQRGISIVAAAVADLPWRSSSLNLIDTPGHADFALEVERSLRVLDGTVLILDAAKGVQAQTRAVWRQASRYRLPAIAYANKMDRAVPSNFHATAQSIRDKLGCDVVPLHLPFVDKQRRFAGLVDLIRMRALHVDGRAVDKVSGDILTQANEARELLIAQLAEMDEMFAEELLSSDGNESLPDTSVTAALRRCTVTRKVMPLLCGSSKLDFGVEELLDATISFLPNPKEQHSRFLASYSPDRLCAMAFKTIFDQHQGLLTFVRVYSGQLSLTKIYNATQSCVEQPLRLLKPMADFYEKTDSARLGDIVVISGLKHTRSGDVLLGSKSDLQTLERISKADSPVNQSLTVPQPVLFAAVEAPSLSAVRRLETALDCLEREDPSLSVRYNPETHQTVLAGMGDLHLEVTVQRIRSQFGVDAKLGSLAISYREHLSSLPKGEEGQIAHQMVVRSDAGQTMVTIDVSVHEQEDEEEDVTFEYRNSELVNWNNFPPQWLKAIESGSRRGLSMAGPLLNSSVSGVHLQLHNMTLSGSKMPSVLHGAIMSCAAEAVQRLLSRCSTVVMEPMMRLEIGLLCDKNSSLLSVVLGDLSRRRARILAVDEREEAGMTEMMQTVAASAPMAELVGYAGDLRQLTSGRAELHLELESYEAMDDAEQQRLLEKIRF